MTGRPQLALRTGHAGGGCAALALPREKGQPQSRPASGPQLEGPSAASGRSRQKHLQSDVCPPSEPPELRRTFSGGPCPASMHFKHQALRVSAAPSFSKLSSPVGAPRPEQLTPWCGSAEGLLLPPARDGPVPESPDRDRLASHDIASSWLLPFLYPLLSVDHPPPAHLCAQEGQHVLSDLAKEEPGRKERARGEDEGAP